MSRQLLLEGPAIEPLLQRVRAEHGSAARIVKAERVRVGGVGGFFAKERFEVTIEVTENDAAVTQSYALDDATGVAPGASGLQALLEAAEAAERASTEVALSGLGVGAPEAAAVLAPEEVVREPVRSGAVDEPVAPAAPQVAPEGAGEHAAVLEQAAPVPGAAISTEGAGFHDVLESLRRSLADQPVVDDELELEPELEPDLELELLPELLAEPELELLPELLPELELEPLPELMPSWEADAVDEVHDAVPAPDGAPQPVPDAAPEPTAAATPSRRSLRRPTTDEPSHPRAPQSTAARLEVLGLHHRWLGDLPEDHVDALRELAARIAELPSRPRRAVVADDDPVVVVIADGNGGLATAQTLALGLGLRSDDVLVPGEPAAPDAEGQQGGPVRIVERVRDRRQPVVVLLTAPFGPDAGQRAAARRAVAALGAHQVWAVVDATRRTADVEAWLRDVGPTGGVDALALTGVTAAAEPAAALELAAPVAMIDGRPAGPVAWGALLAARLTEQDLEQHLGQ